MNQHVILLCGRQCSSGRRPSLSPRGFRHFVARFLTLFEGFIGVGCSLPSNNSNYTIYAKELDREFSC